MTREGACPARARLRESGKSDVAARAWRSLAEKRRSRRGSSASSRACRVNTVTSASDTPRSASSVSSATGCPSKGRKPAIPKGSVSNGGNGQPERRERPNRPHSGNGNGPDQLALIWAAKEIEQDFFVKVARGSGYFDRARQPTRTPLYFADVVGQRDRRGGRRPCEPHAKTASRAHEEAGT